MSVACFAGYFYIKKRKIESEFYDGEVCMNNSKVLVFIFGAIPMTLMQYYLWNWMIKSWTNQIDGLIDAAGYFYIPVIITIIYCICEKYILFSTILFNIKFRDRIPLAVLWILESIIGTIASYKKIDRYEKQFSDTWNIGFGVPMCLLAGAGMIVSFLIFRGFLYRNEKSNN